MKFFKDFFHALKKTKDIKTHEETLEEDFEEFPEPAPRKRNNNQTQATSPSVYGVRKKFIAFIMAGFAAVYLIGFSLGGMKDADTKKTEPTVTAENETARAGGGQMKQVGYGDIMDAQQQEQGSKRVNPLPESEKQGNRNSQENTQLNQNMNPEYQVPPINYQAGYNAPSTGYYAPQFIEPVNTETKSQSNTDDYRKSPIGFSIGFNSAGNSNTSNTAETVSEEVSQISGQPAAQPNIKNTATSKINYIQSELYTLQQGAIIPVSLISGINSDLPGQIIAQVRENVYDSVSGRYLLIPQGSKLLGEVKDGAPKTGQERIGVNWQRLIFPNGISVDLGGMEGVDTAGYAGLKDQVDNHTGKILGATLFSSLLAAGAQIAAGNTGDTSSQSASQMAVSGAATSMMNAGTKMIEKNININPTIKIRPGVHFAVFVNRDLVLKPYR